MQFSGLVRAISIGFAAATIAFFGISAGDAKAENKPPKARAVKPAQTAQDHGIKLRYYGGPKSPMYLSM